MTISTRVVPSLRHQRDYITFQSILLTSKDQPQFEVALVDVVSEWNDYIWPLVVLQL